MRSIVPAIVLSVILLVLVGPAVSAMGVPVVETAKTIVAPQTVVLPAWGYLLLGANLVVAGGLAVFPFVAK
jgi:hypothetical protein